MRADEESAPQLAEAREEIARARQALETLKSAQWYVLGRDAIASYVAYQNDAQRIAKLSQLLPVIFFSLPHS